LLGAATKDPGRIRELWKKLPKHLREQPQLIHARIDALIADGQLSEAESIIRKALDKNWNEELVLLYGQLEADGAAQLRNAESWLRQRPEDAALLLTAARLCMRNELWGKARSYFETSNAIRPSPEAWHDLGQLMLQLGEEGQASQAFQKGLTLSYTGPEVPRLEDQLGSDSG
jgi:HemY protein